MLRRIALPLLNRARSCSSTTASTIATEIPEEHLDKFDVNSPNYTKFEAVDDPEVWGYVERLISDKKVPPCPKVAGPSGWQPVRLTREEAKKLPYFVERTRNHMLPVYLEHDIKGPRYTTVVRKVQGDPWVLRNELKAYIRTIKVSPKKDVITKVNELTQEVGVKGQYVEEIKSFLLSKGF